MRLHTTQALSIFDRFLDIFVVNRNSESGVAVLILRGRERQQRAMARNDINIVRRLECAAVLEISRSVDGLCLLAVQSQV